MYLTSTLTTELSDIKEVSGYLTALQSYELVRLGRELRLNYTNMMRIKHLNSEPANLRAAMLEAWLTNEDEGGQRAHATPTWKRLSVAIGKVGYDDIAKKIIDEKVNTD